MSFEDKEAELGLLLTRMQNEPQDRHELYLQIRQKLNEFKAYGMPLPDTLVKLERQLEAEFEAEKGPDKPWRRLSTFPEEGGAAELGSQHQRHAR